MFKKFLCDENGVSMPEVLIIIAIGCAIAVLLSGRIAPAVKTAHSNIVDRVGSIVGSGF